ncbi:hypothetical protein DFH29DRAFT_821073 [Suillus ampliporus]|nr:hypothetical protein DFH29DRAFT_821073 [Suillus ampliporus]
MALCPPGHHNRPSYLNVLASSLQDRFWERGLLSALYEAIELHQAALAVSLCPPGHYHRPSSLNNLASSLRDWFHQRGIPSDLEDAIQPYRLQVVFVGTFSRLLKDSPDSVALVNYHQKIGLALDY